MSTAIPTMTTALHGRGSRMPRLAAAALLVLAVIAGAFLLGRVTTNEKAPIVVPTVSTTAHVLRAPNTCPPVHAPFSPC